MSPRERCWPNYDTPRCQQLATPFSSKNQEKPSTKCSAHPTLLTKPAGPQMERIVKFTLVPTPSRWVLFPKAFLVHCSSQVLWPLGFLCKICFLIWLICFTADCKLNQCHGTLCPSRGMTRAQLSQAGKEHPSLNSPWHFKKFILDAKGREKILTEGHALPSTYSHQFPYGSPSLKRLILTF